MNAEPDLAHRCFQCLAKRRLTQQLSNSWADKVDPEDPAAAPVCYDLGQPFWLS